MNQRMFSPILGLVLAVLIAIALSLMLARGRASATMGQAQPSVTVGAGTPTGPEVSPSPEVTPPSSPAEISPSAEPSQETSPIPTYPPMPTIPVTYIPTEADPGPFIGTPPWFATPNPTEAARDQRVSHLRDLAYRLPGIIIAQGTNATPISSGFRSYAIEEVTLPGPTNFLDLNGRDITVTKIWRVTIIGRPTFGGAEFWNVWLNDSFLGVALENRNGMTTIAYDSTLLREGATIKVAYGDRGAGPGVEVPERLHFTIQPGQP